MEATTPSATYRLQLRDGITLDALVESAWFASLVELGVSHLYLSPVFAATDGSTHGYDVVDHDRVDPAIGGEDGFARAAEAAHAAGLGVVVDLVPNHEAADPVGNAHWWDVLRNGPASRWAPTFDVEWEAHEARLADRLLLPVLPDHCGREIEAGRFTITVRGDGEPVLCHPSIVVPLELCSLLPLIAGVEGLGSLADRLGSLPGFVTSSRGERELRIVEEAGVRGELHARLVDPGVRHGFLAASRRWVGDANLLDDLLESQPYRLAMWRAGLEDLAYRRFFDVSNLVALRVDRLEVFDATHAIVRRWVASGMIDGVRVDHVDGLADPQAYLERLRSVIGDRRLVVEKILEGDEQLPTWPVEGTTGYEVGALIDRLDVSDAGRADLQGLAARAGAETDYDAAQSAAMAQVLDELLDSDLNRLVDLAVSLCESRRRVRDVTRREVRDVLAALLCRARRYRTYVRSGCEPDPGDLAVIDSMATRAVAETPDLDDDLVAFVRSLLRGECGPGAAEALFVVRFQQLCGATRAKGCEDTAWYRLVTLISRCEVGSDPARWALEPATFHSAMQARQQRWPLGMTSTSTHDSKRSADVRARIDLLSQWSGEFAELVSWWWDHAGRGPLPPFDVYLLQTIVGCPGLDADRLATHVTKALREAKQVTSWLRPDPTVEAEVTERGLFMLGDPETSARVGAFRSAMEGAARAAVLAHALLALTVPGVPDIYQGAETWHHTLVDPDNRRPVDPAVLAAGLDALGPASAPIPVGPDDALAKLALTRTALHLRARRPDAFGPTGNYGPLWAKGPRADHVVAFSRADAAVVVVPRLTRAVAGDWADTALALPDGEWVDLCSGRGWQGNVAVGELLDSWPIALLERGRAMSS